MVRAGGLLVAVWTIGMVVLVSSAGGCGGKTSGPGGTASDGGGPATASRDDASARQGVSGGSASGGSSSSGSSSSSGASSSSGGQSSPGVDAAPPCPGGGLQCYVPAGCTTTLSGTVYDPAGANPLYNAIVFIPNDPSGAIPPITQGADSCNTCNTSIGDYVTATTSAADGTFRLTGVPATTHVPLVVQIGNWRREVFLSQVNGCTDNPLQGSSLTRLPAKRSEGDIPQMALVTGGADNLGCFLKGVGLDPSEYSAPHAGGRLDIYQGQGGGALGGGGSSAPGLSNGGIAGDCTSDNPACVWHSKANLEAYDLVLLGCEGDTYDPAESTNKTTNKTTSSKQALHDWLNEGGKVFATHFHYTWFKNGPADFQGVATWLGSSGGQDNALYNIDTTFPKGKALSQWLSTVGALTSSQISLTGVAESVGMVKAPTQRWIYNSAQDPQQGMSDDTKHLSFLTPVGGVPSSMGDTALPYCGRAIFSDLHAGGSPTGSIPAACDGPPLSAQLKALEFLFFDLSACVSVDAQPPPPPPPEPPK